MTLSNEDLELLKEIELYLYNQNATKNVKMFNRFFLLRLSDVKDEKALKLYFALYNLIESKTKK